ncbi:class I SAM-dependent methyltransferase [Nocardioides sp. BP30]|uniref:class I SAM-dependent methyltransferase n=1 Tax=Nocardioides sp. BP30 TaxID=3036374 RepID=UPI00246898EE|nr:class I SAM-dependent methyltransferase [Nocardioides sp. BP30]WGL52818.1 class I SAM-dependent methyltransferase [Nocardioides sp. BP30]
MTDPALSFGTAAAAYDRGRPVYPREAVAWALGERPLRVLELGAGTGKLTEVLLDLGHDVFATEPDEKMLDVLSTKLPDVRATVGTAEQIPAGDQQYDAVIAGQAFHWFDQVAALQEISRVLAPGGRLVLLWNQRDERIPWVRRLGRLIGRQEQDVDPSAVIDDSALFSAVEEQQFRFWQVVNRETIQDLVLSRSNVTVLAEEDREAKRAEVLAFYDDYGRGMDGMQLPYTCRVFRAAVLEHARPAPAPATSPILISDPVPPTPLVNPPGPPYPPRSMSDTAHRLPRVVTDGVGPGERDDGDDLILIDFR